MMQKKNRGVTLVEVLIALAIFLVLMVPLVSSLVTSVKTTNSAKTTQSRNEYAQVLMENVKNAPIEDLRKATLAQKYLDGSQNISVTPDATKPNDFTILGTTYLGTEHTQYSYKIAVNEVKKSDTYGIMEDFDPNKVAIVPVTFSNYDDVALEAIVTQNLSDTIDSRLSSTDVDDKGRIFNKDTKKQVLDDGTEVEVTADYVDTRSKYQSDSLKTKKVTQSDVNTVDSLRLGNTKIGREIRIKVKGSKNDGYDVNFELSYLDLNDYSDNPKAEGTNNFISYPSVADHYKKLVTYKPYRRHFDTLTNIYVMYNAGVINDTITNDYFTFDLREADFDDYEDNEIDRINAFVIRTATDYTKLRDNYKVGESYNTEQIDKLVNELNEMYKNRNQSKYEELSSEEAETKANEDVEKYSLGTKIKNNNTTLYRKIDESRDKNVSFCEITGADNSKTDRLRVYHNLFKADGTSLVTFSSDDETNGDGLKRVICPHCKKNSTYKSEDSTHICSRCGKNMQPSSSDPEPSKVVDDLQKAHEEVWYIYGVKIWLQEGTIDEVKNLGDKMITLEGTRGGGEIE